ncbi:MAG: hypothetical protein H6502_01790 [Candidatus Woesearchaeota archaeon]|nr:MAG: hypothetical protein H6502_01790 [Candidatus Woesearchaeota archaeon]
MRSVSIQKLVGLLFLSGVILINLFDFFTLLTPEWDLFKKILSWSMMIYVLYHLSFSKILFGKANKAADLLLNMGFFAFALKEVTTYANQFLLLGSAFDSLNTGAVIVSLYSFDIEYYGLLVGMITLLSVAIFYGYKGVTEPSIINSLAPHAKKTLRFFLTLGVLFLVFVSIFNLVMEWFALAIDSIILLATFLFYIILELRTRHLHASTLIRRIASAGSTFYTHLLQKAYEKKNMVRILTGMLIIHPLTDIAIFILPALTGLQNSFYSNLLANEPTFWAYLGTTTHELPLNLKLLFGAGSILSLLGIVSLLTIPAVFWLLRLQNKPANTTLSVMLGFAIFYILMPIIGFSRLVAERYSGAQLSFISPPHQTSSVLIALILAIAVVLLAKRDNHAWISKGTFGFGLLFFGMYLFIYAGSIISAYIRSLSLGLQTGYYDFVLGLILFTITSVCFYVGGYLLLIREYVLFWRKKETDSP